MTENRRILKILYVIEGISAAGGLERVLIDKMNALSAVPGVEVVLLTVWRGQDSPAFRLDDGVGHVSLEVPRPGGRLQLLLALARVLRRYNVVLERICPDVVVHFRAMGAFLLGFGRHSCRTVFESHGVRYSNNHLWLYPRMERRVDTVVCLTEGDRGEYIRQGRCRDVRVIPNFSNVVPVGVPDYEGRHCVYIGRFCPEKDPERLLRLWGAIYEGHGDWTLDIYGDWTPEVCGDWDVGDVPGVRLHGYCDDVASALQGGSMLLLTSRSEGFGLTILEAMRCALPVVSLDTPCGPRDLVVDGVTGFLVPYGDDGAFVGAVSRLMDDVALRRGMGENAAKRANLFDRDAIIGRWVALFKEG